MDPEDLTTGGDLNGVVNDGNLDPTTLVFVPNPIRRGSETHIPTPVNLASHCLADRCLTRALP